MVLAAIGVMTGFYYRIATFILVVLYAQSFLIDTSYYKNHFYLLLLLALILAIIPAHNSYALSRAQRPIVRCWHLWLLKFQFVIVYLFAGINKINADWLNGEPIRGMIANGAINSQISLLKDFLQQPWAVDIFIYGGLLLDLSIPFLLLWIPSRKIAGFGTIIFYTLNYLMIPNIQVFALLMISSLVIFYEPDWPRVFFRHWFLGKKNENRGEEDVVCEDVPVQNKTFVQVFLIIYCLIQLALPLRHFLYEGNIMWTSQGELFSWRMVLKRMAGKVIFKVKDSETQQQWEINPRPLLNNRQYLTMIVTPLMHVQFARFLHSQFKEMGVKSPIVTVDSICYMNNRPLQRMIRPDVNLAEVRLNESWYHWIYPLVP